LVGNASAQALLETRPKVKSACAIGEIARDSVALMEDR
jgi:hypothetical protein